MAFNFISLFTGIGGIDVALERAGGTCVLQVEKDKSALAVLRKLWPNVEKITDVYHAKLRYLRGTIAVLCFGSPCQNASVAGNRKGLDGDETRLFFEAHRIIRDVMPRFVIFENVFGLLSTHEGRDFAVVIGAFTGRIPEVPAEGWGNAGFAKAERDDCYHVAWRVLNAEHFGVPQRRRRVVIVASLGNASCAEILFESEAMCWDFAPRKRSREDTSASIGSCSGGKRTTEIDGAGEYVVEEGRPGQTRIHAYPTVAPTLCANGKAAGSTTGRGAESGHLILEGCFNAEGTPGANLTASNGSHQANNQQPLVVERHAFHVGFNDANGKCPDRPNGGAYVYETDKLAAITTNGQDNPAKIVEAVAFQGSIARGKSNITNGFPTVMAESDGDNAISVAIGFNARQDPVPITNLISGVDGRAQCTPGVCYQDGVHWRVRRLTPVEYERLMAFPDDWTLTGINAKGKEITIKDGPRYKMNGNSVVVLVFAWIAERMARFIQP